MRQESVSGGASGGIRVSWMKAGMRVSEGGDRNCGGLGGVQGGSHDGIT